MQRMKRRFQITLGPKTEENVNKVLIRLRKETAMNWSIVDLLEACAGHGLRNYNERLKIESKPLSTVRE